jgi:lysophospholipase L1-like esterase
MITGAVALAVLVPIALGRGQVDVSESGSDRTPAAETTQPSAEASTQAPTTDAPAEDAPPVVAVYGDSYSAGSVEGGNGPAGWPAIVAGRLGADVRLHAVPGAGYVAGGGGTFLEQVQASPEPDADVVVVFGSRNDTGAATEQISEQAAAVYEAVRAASPSAEMVVIGPAWSDEGVPSDTLLARDAVQSAAEAADLTFVDPLADGWFFGRLELIGADAIHPTDEGHAYLAELIESVLQESLAAANGG